MSNDVKMRADEVLADLLKSARAHYNGTHSGRMAEEHAEMAMNNAAKLFAELIAELELARMRQWQPIETAPRDGTWVLCYGEVDHEDKRNPSVFSAMYTDDLNGGKCDWHWQFAWFDGGYYGWCMPTHWMPLPEPPEC